MPCHGAPRQKFGGGREAERKKAAPAPGEGGGGLEVWLFSRVRASASALQLLEGELLVRVGRDEAVG